MSSRRNFLRGVTAAATAGLVGPRPHAAGAEPPLETKRIRIAQVPAICMAAQYVAEELLRGEGFTDVQYVQIELPKIVKAISAGEIDLSADTAPSIIIEQDAGAPLVALAGIHVGCFELIGTDRVRRIPDLKGKVVAVADPGRQGFVASMAIQVGLDPRKDIKWVTKSGEEAIRLLAEGKIDAYLGFPPEPQEMRAKKIGHVIVSTATDKPWSQYFCCMAFSNREFVRSKPVATKRAIRAILKARPDLRDRAREGGPHHGQPWIHELLRVCPADHEGHPVRPVARVQPGGHAPLLRPAAARGGHDQDEPAEDPPGHGLAFSERAQEGAQGVA